MTKIATMADLVGPILDFGNTLAATIEGTVGAIIDSRSVNIPGGQQSANVEIGQAAAAAGSTLLAAGSVISDSGYLADLNAVVGIGTTASIAIITLPGQLANLSTTQSNYDAAVASGNTGEISSAGLGLASSVSSVVNSVGAIISGVASGLVSAGVVTAATAASIVSVGLAISSAAGLFALTGANAVVDAVRAAASSISSLIGNVESQLGIGRSGQSGSGQNAPWQIGTPVSGKGGLEPGAGSTALGKWTGADAMISPLVLDLTGSGIKLTPLDTYSPYFDLANDGFARRTGWIGDGMGLLCFDPDDQAITNITQLFGNETTDGFDILRKLDSNHDQMIDATDPAFASLRIWVDGNGNGTTDSGELYTLTQLGIVSINLNAAAVYLTLAGNRISSISSYTLTDGTTREIVDAWFANSTMNTKPVVPVDISAAAVALPQIGGAGTLRDLCSAMTLDQELQSLVEAFVGQTSSIAPTGIETAAQAILFEWAGVTQIDPTSRGGAIDARQLGFLEKYLGRTFNSLGDGYNPGVRAAAYLQNAWNDLFDASLARLVLQSQLAVSMAPEFRYAASSDTVQAITTFAPALAAAFQRLGAITPANLASWDLLLRVADAARLDMGMPAPLFEKYVAAATDDTVASVANAMVEGLKLSFDGSGRIQESGTTIYHDYYAGPGVSLLVGSHAGNDPSVQLPGADVFNYSAGDGIVEIRESDPNSSAPSNTLRFGQGVDPSSIKARALSNGSLLLTDGILGDEITLVAEMRDGGTGVQMVQFADGTTWTRQQLIQVAAVSGTTGNDSLCGTSAAEVFDGKGGSDYVRGGGGGDTFIFNAGYGKLEIDEMDTGRDPYNVLQLGAGISKSTVKVRATSSGKLVITDGIASDQVTLDAAMASKSGGVQFVRFSDNSVWTREELIQMATTGTAGNDTLYGTGNAEVFDGRGGSDYVQGGGGGDVFIFNAGYGRLEIGEYDSSKTPHNVLKLGDGISAPSVSVRTTANSSIVLTDGIAGDQITLDSLMSGNSWGVQEVQFADGTIWNRQQLIQMATTGTADDDKIYGTMAAEVLDGRGGNDYVQGGGGGDVFMFNAGYGKLEINEYDSSKTPHNVLKLGDGISVPSVSVRTTANSGIVLTDGIVGDQITLDSFMSGNSWGVQEIQFADGTVWNRQQLIQLTTTGNLGSGMLQSDSRSGTALDGQAHLLIQAMATFTSGDAVFDSTSFANPMNSESLILASASSFQQ
ncbi:Poly(beta-D-mannuronate) C5 epimerase 5 [Burkholderia sp. AD24]|nr:Poly(beta-D-mannuronate) C5 epimerase 5 [Burkholderia sp. AD24]